jgi:myo-inositol 2-dehydrogenase/D-chiro-inositol 1-dehydrogenase
MRTDGPTAVGVIGFGRMGQLHATSVVERVPALTLTAVSDPDERAAAAAADFGVPLYTDWRELVGLPELDAVVICSPSDYHAEQIIAAAKAGKHVFCEKPLDRSLDNIALILDAVAEAGTILQVGFNRRADRNFGALRERLADGEIGTPYLLKITSRDPEPQTADYLRTAGGIFLDMTIHDFDMANFLLGDIVAVSATANALVDPGIAEIGEVDTAVTALTFANGAIGVIDNCRKATYGYDQRVEVHGSLGMLAAENESSSTVVLADASGVHRPPLPSFFLDRYGDAYVQEMQAFADAIGGAPTLADGRAGQHAVEVAVAAAKSLAEQRSVEVAEIATSGAVAQPAGS